MYITLLACLETASPVPVPPVFKWGYPQNFSWGVPSLPILPLWHFLVGPSWEKATFLPVLVHHGIQVSPTKLQTTMKTLLCLTILRMGQEKCCSKKIFVDATVPPIWVHRSPLRIMFRKTSFLDCPLLRYVSSTLYRWLDKHCEQFVSGLTYCELRKRWKLEVSSLPVTVWSTVICWGCLTFSSFLKLIVNRFSWMRYQIEAYDLLCKNITL